MGEPRLVSARDQGVYPIDAIHAALTGNPWLPIVSNAVTSQLNGVNGTPLSPARQQRDAAKLGE